MGYLDLEDEGIPLERSITEVIPVMDKDLSIAEK